jgi:hypothetical protein
VAPFHRGPGLAGEEEKAHQIGDEAKPATAKIREPRGLLPEALLGPTFRSLARTGFVPRRAKAPMDRPVLERQHVQITELDAGTVMMILQANMASRLA